MRPVEYGQAVIDRDIANLERILRRVNSDPKRLERERKILQKNLKEIIHLLHNGKREIRSVGTRKSA